MSVKRFLVRDDAGAANDEAAWVETVLASDYDALAAELAESQRALSVCSKGFDAMCKRAVAAEARIRDLEAALTLLTNGFKYSTEVVTVAREALAAETP